MLRKSTENRSERASRPSRATDRFRKALFSTFKPQSAPRDVSWRSGAALGVLLGALGALLACFGVVLGALGLLCGALEGSGGALGRSWHALGMCWLARLGASECPNDCPNDAICQKKIDLLIDDPASTLPASRALDRFLMPQI